MSSLINIRKIAIPKEICSGEYRVAIIPGAVTALVKAGFEVQVEVNAGSGAFFSDIEYQKAGAKTILDTAELFGEADLVAKVQVPIRNEKFGYHEVDLMREGAVLVAMLQPLTNLDSMQWLARRKITGFSMDNMPRISRAQSMDARSSQAAIAGYKAVLIAAETLRKVFPMLTTAAGTIFASRVLVLGAGVAGLQAIATARRLGALVYGYDVRPVVKEQVESLGAKFLEFEVGDTDVQDKGGYAKQLSPEAQQRQREWLTNEIKSFDVVITTALVPGKAAPRFITRNTVEQMRPGSVIVDLAAEAGGNCEVTVPGKVIDHNGVIIHGPLNLPSTISTHASQMYARNITNFLAYCIKDGKLNLDLSDELIQESLITHQGEIVNKAIKTALITGDQQ
jgi:H+-translocating NAD(P) transhydrogenase subunit alpha